MAYPKGIGGHRRRRVLTEQARGESGPTSAGGEGPPDDAGSAAPYESDVLSGGQTLLGLVPSRLGGMLLLALSALTGVAALVALDLYRADWGRLLRADHAVGLDLAGRGSLADWYASLLLLAASIVALIVFSVRRHKRDDYHGRYRVWIWVALAGLAASVDATAHLRLVAWDLLLVVTEKDFWSLGPWAWLVPLIVVVGLLSVRLAVELWASRGAWVLAAFAGGTWTVAWALGRGWLDAPGWAPHTTCVATLVLVGHVLLLVSLVAYARHVILEAGGERPPRVARKKKAKTRTRRSVAAKSAEKKSAKAAREQSGEAAEKTAPTSKRVEVHAAPEGRKRGEKQRSAGENRDTRSRRSETTQWVDGSDGPEGNGGDGPRRKLSKAERKRLRKQKARERREA